MKPFSKFFLVSFILIFVNFCFTKEVIIPKDNLYLVVAPPVYADAFETNSYLFPVFSEIKNRPDTKGKVYYTILKDKEQKRILRSIAILVDDHSLKLKPEEYLHYPVYYANSTSKSFRVWHHYNMTYDIRRAADNSPVYVPVYTSASVASFAAFGVFYVASTGTAFLLGLGKGTYEFTEDIMEGISINQEEVVLAYNDYTYDEQGRMTKITTYLPYRSISKSVIPLYDREGKKQIGQVYPTSKPILVSQMDFQYIKGNQNPKSVNFIEYLPKKNQKLVRLPIKGNEEN
ncbi:hypothetical protein LEP1GSC202_1716 [Leptospira yanagawae serovar Saopaulo str. Sao Paulo = ATCC 700523]|uniref:Uncharacterized protein n=1 Tax=Leptospira yanagawae serovar Saopaulo str. Sao Paulo = ATCC 700523 TaxID=1249483 RepID=A0A5E8HFI8_9LEPT|nr:hypothetical protein [Leptospira yanagawae]EOQ89672.1 hypothetical protein LEP1GSC202_1716 [Leptospira yanagawae serovar Saopaulo str. Sao Paulo = ATCC 700523]